MSRLHFTRRTLSNVFGFMDTLFLVMTFPAKDQTRSEGAAEDGAAKYFLAMMATVGYWTDFSFHHSVALSVRVMEGSRWN